MNKPKAAKTVTKDTSNDISMTEAKIAKD